MMLHEPFYDPKKTYEENFAEGPFGAFANGEILTSGEPKYEFLGQKVNSLFGIPAGPLINANFCRAAFQKGFDICVYKTVRSDTYPCHPFPNVLSVKVEGDLTMEKAQEKLVADDEYVEPISITNSFGVPSRDVPTWQADVKKALASAGPGQVLVLGFMGTVKEGQTEEGFIADYALAAKLAKETGVKILETNLSCPNIGNEGLVCYNLDMTEKVCAAIRKEIGDTPLLLKVGYYKDYADVKKLAEIAGKYAQGISAINTISAEVVDKDGKQALPGKNRVRSGVCGSSIKWAGLEMVGKLKQARAEVGGNWKIVGVGGVTKAEDFKEYLDAGADAVMSATGAMWNPYLAREIKSKYNI
ncbi:MAG TPA: tRNA-dihydrouridine synthase [Candidatus Paceibacterota bacterium]|nr:tRNA-dihydrouridine synthase [Candidatus Paceibacterota bacterium]